MWDYSYDGSINVLHNHYDCINLLHHGEKMRIKTEDLELLLWYLKKEKVETTNLTEVDQNFEVFFEFKDSENRDCEIVIYDCNLMNKPVRLKKEMDLETRLEKEDK